MIILWMAFNLLTASIPVVEDGRVVDSHVTHRAPQDGHSRRRCFVPSRSVRESRTDPSLRHVGHKMLIAITKLNCGGS